MEKNSEHHHSTNQPTTHHYTLLSIMTLAWDVDSGKRYIIIIIIIIILLRIIVVRYSQTANRLFTAKLEALKQLDTSKQMHEIVYQYVRQSTK